MDDEKELDDVLKEAIKEAEEAENSRVLYERCAFWDAWEL